MDYTHCGKKEKKKKKKGGGGKTFCRYRKYFRAFCVTCVGCLPKDTRPVTGKEKRKKEKGHESGFSFSSVTGDLRSKD